MTPPDDLPIALTCIDRGGTFTDVAYFVRQDAGLALHSTLKVPSDEAVIGELARGPLVFGTTVATNALLEGRGDATVLFVTRGLGELALLGDGHRPDLFDPDRQTPPMPVSAIIEVDGRLDAEGRELEPLTLPEVPSEIWARCRSAAVVLLHGGTNPAHEQRLAAYIRARAPDWHITMGHTVSRARGYLSRIQTAWVDAAVTPVLARALARDRIPAGARALRSDGSLVAAEALRAPEAVLSGPSGGVLAVSALAAAAGFSRAIGLDMGGTSTDVCCVEVGALPLREGDLEVAGIRLRTRMLEVSTIAAGGGSILASDGLRLTVGPESAGADPGPQCYGRGGPPTITDAALRLGLMDPDAFPFALCPERIALPGDAAAFVAIARESMAQAIRRLAMLRGLDPTEHVLVALGGAGPQHAVAVAALLGVDTVLVPSAAPVLCAFGAALAVEEHSLERDLWRPLDRAIPDLEAQLAALEAQLPRGPEWSLERILWLRAVGTDHALAVPWQGGQPAESLIASFRETARRRYGFDRHGTPRPSEVEVERLEVRVRNPRPPLPQIAEADPRFPRDGLAGPTVWPTRDTSIVIPKGWSATAEPGFIRLVRHEATRSEVSSEDGTARTPAGIELWQNRFLSLADEAGAVLARLARSVNIRERRDFSCAIFDARGRLVANAPHVPVHLGAMGETVRDLLGSGLPLRDGASYLTNDPAAGGSHLPDLTVVTVAGEGPEPFFVASRAHHADVGGLTPGSMPPHSRHLDEEGLVFRREVLVDGEGRALYWEPPFRARVAASRQPETLLADLEAQLAANHHMASGLRGLGEPARLRAWMDHLRAAAREEAERCILDLGMGVAADTLDGLPLRLALSRVGGARPRLRVDLCGTGGPHPGNLNAPVGVVRASVLFALRVLIARDMPLNDGVLEAVEIVTPPVSVVSPPPGAAVVGGNVETSQRLVDLLFRACGARAESQGTMNNLVLGGPGWSFYETIAGGLGASPRGDGVSARQVHMTNTRATDPEVLESRLPLRLLSFRRREGSGGAGASRGGDGVIRELEVCEETTATLLACWRPEGARGLAGGQRGQAGAAFIDGSPWGGEARQLLPGARVRIETPGGGGYGTEQEET